MIIKQAYLPLIGRVCFFLDRYTDNHNINEDILAISDLGGDWRNGLSCGMFYRPLNDAPSASRGIVASRLTIRTTHHSQYTDFHDIDEDINTISSLGGQYRLNLHCGVLFRHLASGSSVTHGAIASRSSTIDRHDILIHTDSHDIDEDIRTISSFNGCHMDDAIAGIFYRFLFDVPSMSFGNVASRLPIEATY